jgi:hypothetical protein
MKSSRIKHKQLVTQDLSNRSAQLPDVADSCPINAKPINQVPRQQIKCVIPMTFSQKLSETNYLEIAEQFEQAIDANSLEQIKILLDRLVKVGN